jgi:hypothetical protein
LIRVSRSLADKHEIAMCFTEQMIRGGVDTLTTEDLERAYEVYAANTVEFYVCTDSTQANANGLKLNRSSRMARETVLMPGEGSTILAYYTLNWYPYYGTIYDKYGADIRIRVDWNYQGVSGVVNLYPYHVNFSPQMIYLNQFRDVVIERNNNGELEFSAESDFNVLYGNMNCYFMMWVKQQSFTQQIKLTMTEYITTAEGVLYLSNDNVFIQP